MKKLSFNRVAERELAMAVAYYDKESPGLGDRFLDEVWYALALVRRHPEAAPKVSGPFRRFVLPQFPYYIIYRLIGNRLRVMAIAHQKRHPRYWRGRT